MPELPEVETVCRDLEAALPRGAVAAVLVRFPGIVKSNGAVPAELLRGRKVSGVSRRGKCALIRFGDDVHLVVHLGMSGCLRVERMAAALPDHTHLIVRFRGSRRELRFQDPRRFGFLRLCLGSPSREDGFVSRLGPEPLDLSPREFWRRIHLRRRMLKALLLDQKFIAGLGNIYVDESLYLARLHPRRNSATIDRRDSDRLLRAVRRVLRDAIEAGGTSLRDYRRPGGDAGRFQRRLRVYGRQGTPCPRCGAVFIKEFMHGRGTHYCPVCQAGSPPTRCLLQE